MRRDGIAVALNALSDTTRGSAIEADLRRMLSTGDGPGYLLRALFEDCSLETLDRLAATFGVSRAELRAACDRARTLHAAADGTFDMDR